MFSVFADTSSLVKFYYPEADSDKIEFLLLKADRIYLSSLTMVEFASALQKKVRMNDLDKLKETLIWNTFLDDMQTSQMKLISLDDRHYSKAADLIREYGGKYSLRTLDSLHLAVAHELDGTDFLCSDKILSKVAVEMGIKLVDV